MLPYMAYIHGSYGIYENPKPDGYLSRFITIGTPHDRAGLAEEENLRRLGC